MQIVELPYCTIKNDGSIIILVMKEDAVIDVAETREMIKLCAEMAGNKPYVILSDTRVLFTITPEGRKIAADINEAPLLRANAVLVNNLPSRLLANFFGKFYKLHFEFKLFTKEKKAVEWLLSVKSKLEEVEEPVSRNF